MYKNNFIISLIYNIYNIFQKQVFLSCYQAWVVSCQVITFFQTEVLTKSVKSFDWVNYKTKLPTIIPISIVMFHWQLDKIRAKPMQPLSETWLRASRQLHAHIRTIIYKLQDSSLHTTTIDAHVHVSFIHKCVIVSSSNYKQFETYICVQVNRFTCV